MLKNKNNFLIFSSLPLLTGFILFLIWALPMGLNATMKLKKVHTSVNLNCKSCHHKPQKKCSVCHIGNLNSKVSSFDALPEMGKKMHQKCRTCHSAKGADAVGKISSYVKSNSKCKLCH